MDAVPFLNEQHLHRVVEPFNNVSLGGRDAQNQMFQKITASKGNGESLKRHCNVNKQCSLLPNNHFKSSTVLTQPKCAFLITLSQAENDTLVKCHLIRSSNHVKFPSVDAFAFCILVSDKPLLVLSPARRHMMKASDGITGR